MNRLLLARLKELFIFTSSKHNRDECLKAIMIDLIK